MSPPLNRRNFLCGAAALGVAARGRALAGPLPGPATPTPPSRAGTPALVVIYLRGGADCLNMVIPHADEAYAALRPGIAIGPGDGRIELDERWALHPALAELEPLWRTEELAAVVNVGSPHETRSHFDAQDFMEFAAPGDRTLRQGWLNRYLAASASEESGNFRALGMQGLLPRSLRGSFPVLAVPQGFGSGQGGEALDAFERFYGADEEREGDEMGARPEETAQVFSSGATTIETLRRFEAIVSGAKRRDNGYPRSSFARGLMRVAEVIEAEEGLEVAGIDYNGWDHHAGQGGVEGKQAEMMVDLAGSLAAFCRHLGPRLERTAILVMSEFGRTAAENGNDGTDHGHGGGMLLIGGGVRGGQVLGEWRGLSPERLWQGRDLPVTTDFRDVFAAVLRQQFDFKAPRDFFPDYTPGKLRWF